MQPVERAVDAMHVVGMVQEEREAGSQQPCTPWRVFVAQTKFEFWHVKGSSYVVVSVVDGGEAGGPNIRDEPAMKPHVFPPWAV